MHTSIANRTLSLHQTSPPARSERTTMKAISMLWCGECDTKDEEDGGAEARESEKNSCLAHKFSTEIRYCSESWNHFVGIYFYYVRVCVVCIETWYCEAHFVKLSDIFASIQQSGMRSSHRIARNFFGEKNSIATTENRFDGGKLFLLWHCCCWCFPNYFEHFDLAL